MFSLLQLMTISLVYLVVLFGSAYMTERGLIPQRIVDHPATRILSLGVFAGTLAFYGAIGFAAEFGVSFAFYFIGASCAFLLTPVLLGPMSRIALAHKLGSLADLFAFRYPARWVGGVVTLLMLLGVLPLLALQIQAVAGTIHLLNQRLGEEVLAMVFCTTITVFAILFGARHLSTRDKHQGLVVAMGLESVIKLLAIMIIAWYCTFHVFGGVDELAAFAAQQQVTNALSNTSSRVLLVLFFAAAVTLPHVYHMLITENADARSLSGASWGFPAYMAAFSACIPPIYLAGRMLAPAGVPAEFLPPAIGISLENPMITLLAFMICMAASSSVLIVTTLALASMTLNHLLLPLYRPSRGVDIYLLLLNGRRALIVAIILAAFLLHLLLRDQRLVSLALVALTAVLQFLPGLLAGFHWHRANRKGLLAGLLIGFGIWGICLLLPLIDSVIEGVVYLPGPDDWQLAIILSVSANCALFVAVSWLTNSSVEETLAAAACTASDGPVTPRGEIAARSVPEMENSLATALGRAASSREVMLALDELRFAPNEVRPHALTRLREQMETNLSSMLGQTIAHQIIATVLPLKPASGSFHQMEEYLEGYRSQLTGLAAELDSLRQYHRQLLHLLPTAVCSIDQDMIVRTWNQAMEQVTAIPAEKAIASEVMHLPEPWDELFQAFVFDDSDHHKMELGVAEETRWFSLHKATLAERSIAEGEMVIVLEDLTDSHLMEEQLIHKERLASIGQFAAGVAHEVGNPVTGIACLAQDLKLEITDPELIRLSDEILSQTNRISGILQSLVNFAYGNKANSDSPRLPVNIHQCVDEAIRLTSLAREANISMDNRCAHGVRTAGDPQRLVQVFVNVLANAQDASTPGSVVTIDSWTQDQSINITVTDDGHGIDQTHLKQIFEPFFTTKDPHEGTGLGLAIVATIVEEHHGSIHAERVSEDGGTRVVIRLPLFTGE